MALFSLAMHAETPGVPVEYRESMAAMASGDLDRAARLLQRVIEESPEFAPAYYRLVAAFREREHPDYVTPRRFFEAQIRKYPQKPYALLGLAWVDVLDEQQPQVHRHLIPCVEKLPGWIGCLEFAGRLNTVDSNLEKMIFELASQPNASSASLIGAGFRHRLNGQSSQAERAFRRGQTIAPDGRTRAIALLGLGQILIYPGNRLAEASGAAEEVLGWARANDDSDLVIESLQLLKEKHYRSRSFVAMMDCLKELQAITSRTRPMSERVELWRGMARAFMETGDAAGAIRTLQECLQWRIFPRHHETLVLTDLGEAEMSLGRSEDADNHFLQALQSATALKAPWHAAWAIRCRGQLAMSLGDYGKAAMMFEESLRRFRDIDAPLTWVPMLSMAGRAYAQLGDYDRAEALVRQSLDGAVKYRETPEIQRIQNTLAEIQMSLGKGSEAVRLWRSTIALAKGFNGPAGYVLNAHLSLTHALIEGGKAAEALHQAEDARLLITQQPSQPAVSGVWLALGSAQAATGDLVAAEQSLRLAVSAALEGGNREQSWRARLALSRILPANLAIPELRAAIEDIEKSRGHLAGTDQRASFLSSRTEPYARIVELLGLAGRAEEAIEFAEMAKGRATLETLAERTESATWQLTSVDLDTRAQLLRNVSRSSAAALERPSNETRAGLRKAEEALRVWIREARAKDPAYVDLHYPEPLKAGAMRDTAMRSGGAVVMFALGAKASFGWVVTPTKIRMARLPAASAIALRVRRLLVKWSERPTSLDAEQRDERWVVDQLIQPLELKGQRRITIVPDGILNYFPFEAAGNMGKEHTISYAPSLSSLRQLLERSKAPAPKELLALGAPRLRGQVPGIVSTVRSAYARRGMRFEDLPYARKEIGAIGSLYPVRTRTLRSGVDATEEWLKGTDLSAFRRVHFATHALLDENLPKLAALVLAPSGKDDGFLQLPEIYSLRLNAELVVLSACKTGLGELVSGEGVRGLTSAFLYAGAQRVVVSLWEVSDIATSELMTRFYVGMKSKRSPAEALQLAKQQMIESGVAAYKHPYFWAGFVLVGLQ